MTLSEILDRLVGNTDVWCETNHDNESIENLDKLEDVAYWVKERIMNNLQYSSRNEYSARKIVARTKQLIINSGLDDLGGIDIE